MVYSQYNNIIIDGIACCVPEGEADFNEYISQFGKNNVDKISQLTSVKHMFHADEKQTASDLGFAAAKKLLEEKHIETGRVGALIFVSQTPDYQTPATACVLQHRLELSKDCICFDINLGCSAYVYGLNTLAALMATSNIEYGLVIIGDTLSKKVSPKDRSLRLLIGDACSATLLKKKADAPCISAAFRSDGSQFKDVIIPAGCARNPVADTKLVMWEDGNERSDFNFYMSGTSVMLFSLGEVPALIKDFIDNQKITLNDYDAIIVHQANAFIIKQLVRHLKIDKEKMPVSLEQYGNTSGCSIPLTIVDQFSTSEGKDLHLLLCGFGVGLSLGVMDIMLSTTNVLPLIKTGEYYTEGGVSHD